MQFIVVRAMKQQFGTLAGIPGIMKAQLVKKGREQKLNPID